MNIEELLKNVYNFIIWMNVNIFEPLNGSVRIDAFVGIVGVLVAIVIFIAETMNDKKSRNTKKICFRKNQNEKYHDFFNLYIINVYHKGNNTI